MCARLLSGGERTMAREDRPNIRNRPPKAGQPTARRPDQAHPQGSDKPSSPSAPAIGICDPVAEYAEAIGKATQANWEIVSTAKAALWLLEGPGRIVVFTIASQLDANIVEGDTFRTVLDRIVVAVPALSETEARRYLAVGVGGVVDRASPPDVIAAVIEATATGYVALSVDLAYQLTKRLDVPPADVDQRCVEWLQKRVDGASVKKLADKYAYSTRDVYRRFSKFYAEIGATRTLDAIVILTRWGLIH